MNCEACSEQPADSKVRLSLRSEPRPSTFYVCSTCCRRLAQYVAVLKGEVDA